MSFEYLPLLRKPDCWNAKIKANTYLTGHLKSTASCTNLRPNNQCKEQAELLPDLMNLISKTCGFSSDTLHIDHFAGSFTVLLSWQQSNIKALRDSVCIHIHFSSLTHMTIHSVRQYLKLHLMNLVILCVVFVLLTTISFTWIPAQKTYFFVSIKTFSL